MECLACKTTNNDDALFCKHCGKRLDGKQSCPSCGADNDFDALFCNKCGAPMMDTVKKRRPTASSDGEVTLDSVAGAQPSSWKRVLEIIGWVFAMIGLFFSVLFTFFIGMGAKVTGRVDGVSASASVKYNIYYFFSDAYQQVSTDVTRLSEYEFIVSYFPAIIGTIVAVGVIVSVITLASISVVRFVKYVRGKSERDFAKFTVATYLVFLIGAVVLLGLQYVSAYISSSSGTYNVVMEIDSATKAGVIIGGISLFAFVALRFAVNGRKILQKENVLKLIFCAVAIVVCGVLLGILPQGAITIKEVSESYYTGTYTEKTSYSVFYLVSLYMLGSSNTVPTDAVFISVFALLAQVVMVVLVAVTLLNQLVNILGAKTKNPLALSIPTFVFAIGYLGLVVGLKGIMFQDISDGISINTAIPIVILIFAALNFASSIVQVVLCKSQKQTEITE